jgi:hypothetical protein
MCIGFPPGRQSGRMPACRFAHERFFTMALEETWVAN